MGGKWYRASVLGRYVQEGNIKGKLSSGGIAQGKYKGEVYPRGSVRSPFTELAWFPILCKTPHKIFLRIKQPVPL